ncbi:hypothetical protein [Oceanimonas smirnovii]|uniref:hypothetical protein n=1 Tax=Oceanimonas smirnovii TaxID=264574 RepID=UPI00036C476C|nr:hypothetical protein [Oceanimonas smirnovii]
MTIYLSNAIENATSIEQVVELINEGTCEGMEGIEFTADILAGQYAWSAAKDFVDSAGMTADDLEAQLEFLSAAGAVFSESVAVDHGLKLAAADTE